MDRVAPALAAVLLTTGCTSGLSLTLTAAAEEPGPSSEVGEPALVVAETSTASPTSASPPSTTTTTSEPAPEPVVLGFAGDVNMIRGAEDRAPLDAVADLLGAPDLMMVNLETVIGEADEVGGAPIPKEYVFRSPPETLTLLLEAGVDVVGLANNHSWDYGPRGVAATTEHVAASDMVGVGVGDDARAAHAPVFIDINGLAVGVASLTLVPCDWSLDATAERPEIAYACDRYAVQTYGTIAELLTGSDVSVVLVHGSEELADCPTTKTRQVVTGWMELGVDLVVVSHPHVLGGVERFDDAVVLWSTGNFAFPNNGGRTGRSAVFEVIVDPDGVGDVRVHPTVLPAAIASPASPELSELVRAEVSERSPGLSVDETGLLVPDDAPSVCDPSDGA